jgi:hypothetical protein
VKHAVLNDTGNEPGVALCIALRWADEFRLPISVIAISRYGNAWQENQGARNQQSDRFPHGVSSLRENTLAEVTRLWM